jgi:hypothetical protein
MMTSLKDNIITLHVKRDHDKLCILEKFLISNNLSAYEYIISNLIDSIISNKKK